MKIPATSVQVNVVSMTPKLAREYLAANTNNRRLRTSRVHTLREAFLRGEYVFTHQGIAIDSEGVLLDGQTRLSAIAGMPDTTRAFPILVTTGLDRVKVWHAIDTTPGRNLADVANLAPEVAQVAHYLARVYAASSIVTPKYAFPFVALTEKATSDLMRHCARKVRVWSSATFRAAAVVSLLRGQDADHVKGVYAALVTHNYAAMPPVAHVLCRMAADGLVNPTDRHATFLLGLFVFDAKNSLATRIHVGDQVEALRCMRAWLRVQLGTSAPDFESRVADDDPSEQQAKGRRAA